MPKKTEPPTSLVDVVKGLNADGQLKQRAYRFLRCDLGKLETANDFAQASGDLASLATLLLPLGHKDYIKIQSNILKELRHLAELKNADRMLTPSETADRLMGLFRQHLPQEIWARAEAGLREFFYDEETNA